ncbi:MAG: NAD(P)-dependent oxidoreductase [Clostridia bacterium]|nr:NAD(P)-dependent oxidoreductase [Clostridia bacterium]
MNILITGAYGNIGGAVIDEALKRNHSIVVFERKNKRTKKAASRYRKLSVGTIFGDITKYEDVRKAVAGMDAVIHLAGIIPPGSNNRALCFAVNAGGTANVARAIIENGNNAALIHSSSCSVMGPTQHLEPPVTVDREPRPVDNYTESKVLSEDIVKKAGLNLYCITRLGAVMPSKGIWKLKTLVYSFEIDYDSRIEIILDSDVGLAQVTAAEKLRLNMIESGNTYFLGGGDKCRLRYGDFFNGLLRSIGIPGIKKESFTLKPSFLDWLDTQKAQGDLDFQRHSYSDYLKIFRKNMKRLIPLTKLFGGLAARVIKGRSPYKKTRVKYEPGPDMI